MNNISGDANYLSDQDLAANIIAERNNDVNENELDHNNQVKGKVKDKLKKQKDEINKLSKTLQKKINNLYKEYPEKETYDEVIAIQRLVEIAELN